MLARIISRTSLRHVPHKLRELLREASDVRYVSIPIWRPWRNF
jgi:hypothetical protein